jgi:hypothetical protein
MGLLFLATALLLAAVAAAQSVPSDLPPGSAALVQTADLAKTVQSASAKPLIFYVGPRFLYAQAHIRGAEFIGPASESDSAERLRKRVAALPRKSRIVLYCGCCPWEHCPNIRPAYHELVNMGFTDVKALYLPNNFGTDWVEKGYPVEKGD